MTKDVIQIQNRRSGDRREDEGQLDIKGPGGLSLGLKGTSTQILSALLIAVAFSAGVYFLYQHDQKTDSGNAKVIAAVQELTESQRAMIYVSTLKQEDREKLNLLKPKSLGDMQR